eukprot:1661066-Rhodomonas_salina.1
MVDSEPVCVLQVVVSAQPLFVESLPARDREYSEAACHTQALQSTNFTSSPIHHARSLKLPARHQLSLPSSSSLLASRRSREHSLGATHCCQMHATTLQAAPSTRAPFKMLTAAEVTDARAVTLEGCAPR